MNEYNRREPVPDEPLLEPFTAEEGVVHMRLRKPLPGILTLLALAVIATGCLNLSGPKSASEGA